jgi:hypothetical protein
MQHTLHNLSDREWELYNITISLEGTMENKERQLTENGTFDKYRIIHKDYYELCDSSYDAETALESLKRLIFLNWYSILEPSFLTGMENLNNDTIFKSFAKLNDYIHNNKLDEEFKWMLSFYSSWDYLILTYSENKLPALTNFIKSINHTLSHIPAELSEESMRNRGQMGIYWTSHI